MTRFIRLPILLGLACALIASSTGSASATDFKFGEVTVSLDNTVSFGVGIRTHGQDCSHISQQNGGCPNSLGTYANVNTDDGDVNFDQWDAYAATAKIVTDIEAKYQNLGAFVRVKGYYDYIGDREAGENSTRFGRRPLDDSIRGDDAGNAAGRGFSLLDAFAYGNFNVGDLPLNLRAGKQVVNWGESLAIAGGINQFLAVDLSALRTPGAEIKEALLPQEMLFASLGLPASFNVETWVGLRWRKTTLDPVGTFFSQADVAGPGGAYLQLGAPDAPGSPGQLIIDEGMEPSDFGQYGAKLGYYADWLNQGTELGLYYVHYSSNLPYIDYSNATAPGNALGGQRYRFEYPHGIELYGASFATTLDWLLNGSAFSGEILYQPNLPFSLSAGETLLGRWADLALATPGFSTNIPYDNTVGAYGGGYAKQDAISGQLSTISTLSTSEGITRALNADLIVLVANWGFQYLPNISQDVLNSLAVSRSETQVPNANGLGLIVPAAQPLEHPDTFSHGYRLIASVQYNNAFDTPWTLTPSVQFGQDFNSSAGPIGPGFLDNRKSLSVGVRGNYQKTWSAGVQYTLTRGNNFQNLMDDRDFMTFDVSYAF